MLHTLMGQHPLQAMSLSMKTFGDQKQGSERFGSGFVSRPDPRLGAASESGGVARDGAVATGGYKKTAAPCGATVGSLCSVTAYLPLVNLLWLLIRLR